MVVVIKGASEVFVNKSDTGKRVVRPSRRRRLGLGRDARPAFVVRAVRAVVPVSEFVVVTRRVLRRGKKLGRSVPQGGSGLRLAKDVVR